MPRRKYSEEVRQSVLARIESGETAYQVAREQGIPQTTVAEWTRHVRIAAETVATVTEAVALNAGTRWAAVQERATTLLTGNLDRYVERGTNLEPHEMKDVAIIAGISSDKFLDHTQGRKGTQVNVTNDNRTVNVLEAMPREKLLELLSGNA